MMCLTSTHAITKVERIILMHRPLSTAWNKNEGGCSSYHEKLSLEHKALIYCIDWVHAMLPKFGCYWLFRVCVKNLCFAFNIFSAMRNDNSKMTIFADCQKGISNAMSRRKSTIVLLQLKDPLIWLVVAMGECYPMKHCTEENILTILVVELLKQINNLVNACCELSKKRIHAGPNLVEVKFDMALIFLFISHLLGIKNTC